jgi:hypothetical protein
LDVILLGVDVFLELMFNLAFLIRLNFMIPFKTQMNVLGKLFNQYLAKKRLVECVAWEEW